MAPTITPPRVPAQLEELDLAATVFEDDTELDGVRLVGAAPELAVLGLELAGAELRDVDLGAARLPRLALRNCLVAGGNLANVAVRAGTAERTVFDHVRLTGLTWHEGVLRDVVFTGCRIDLASLASTRLERVRFEGCVLAHADLQDARLSAVTLDGCDLTGADLTGARFGPGCVLRGCTLDGARGVEALRGARMPYEDVLAAAATFAGALGIELLTDDDEEDR